MRPAAAPRAVPAGRRPVVTPPQVAILEPAATLRTVATPGNGGVDFTYTPPGMGGAGGSCVDEVATAEPLPLDIYFMLDRSGSMDDPFSNGDCNVTYPNAPTLASKWCHAINAIAGYAQDPSSNGNRAAIEYFSGNTCTGYDTPAVNLVDLTAQAGQLTTSMNAQNPSGNTPTSSALNGLATFTAANQTQNRVIIGVLITDGDPTRCSPTDDAGLSAIIQNHFDATGIHTFVVGMNGATFSRLENWADYNGALSHDDTNNACGTCNGGACSCHHYNVGNGDPAVFIAALQQIQNAVLGCTYAIPQPSMGVLDPNAVTVDYLPGGMPPAQTLPRVNDVNACAGPGWYFDDNMNPTQILLCPDSCTTVQADPNAQVEFSIDCQGS